MTYFRIVVEDSRGVKHFSPSDATPLSAQQVTQELANSNGRVWMELRSGGYRVFDNVNYIDIEEISREAYEREHD